MDTVLNNVMNLANDFMGYIRLVVIGTTAVFVAKEYAVKMASNDDNQRAGSDRKIKNTIIAGVCALVASQLVSWVLGYFK